MLVIIPRLIVQLVKNIKSQVKRDSIRISRLTIASNLVSLFFIFFVFPYGGLLNIPDADSKQTTVKLDTNSAFVLTEPDQTVNIPVGMSRSELASSGLAHDPAQIKLLMQEIAPEYGIDWRFVYAIGWIESGYNSSLARRSYNFFGRKASSRTWMSYSSPETAIRDQFVYLRDHYYVRGLDTPYEIGPIYCEGNTWAGKVTSVMRTL